MKRTIIGVLLCGLFASCTSLPVEALRAHYDEVQPNHMSYIRNDPTMRAEEIARWERLWKAYDVLLSRYESR